MNRIDKLCDKLITGKIKPSVGMAVSSLVRNQTTFVALEQKRIEMAAKYGSASLKQAGSMLGTALTNGSKK